MLWDIFCRVIDNFGDIGVSWRLAADLAARGHSVRLWTDDARALEWMAPGALQGQWPGVQVLAWEQACKPAALQTLPYADVWVETFGCEIPAPFVAHFAAAPPQRDAPHPVWINLEYLSAEPYVERSHALPSPVLTGPAQGWEKYFFYPGFTAKTGGLLREPDAVRDGSQAAESTQWLAQRGLPTEPGRVVSLFCYEPPLLERLLNALASGSQATHVLVTQGRAQRAVQALLGPQRHKGALQVHYLPWLSQQAFDSLLRSCDLNFVRGEDSVLRAIWAGKPFVWHIYPQDDGADAPKLEAFMEQLQLSAPVRRLHRAWNGYLTGAEAASTLAALAPAGYAAWQTEVQAARDRLLKMDSLTLQLLRFVQKKR